MKRLICRLRGHRWKDIRVIRDIDFKGTDQYGAIGFVVKDAEWQIRCARCGETAEPTDGEISAASFGFKP